MEEDECWEGLLGEDHPLIVVPSWQALPSLLESMDVDALQRQCSGWWSDYKAKMHTKVRALVGL